MLLPLPLLSATPPPDSDDAADFPRHASEPERADPLQGLNPPLSPEAAPAPEQAEAFPTEDEFPAEQERPPFLLEAREAPPPFPTYEAPLPPPPAEPAPPSLLDRLGRAGFVLGLVVFVAALGYWLAPDGGTDGPGAVAVTSLFESAIRAQRDVREVVRTTDPTEASEYLRERFGQRVAVPQIAGASLLGVGTARIGDVDVPALLFDDAGGERMRVLVFSYALLERYPSLLGVAPQTLNRLESASHVEAVGRQQTLLWRDRDDLFLAVTRDAGALQRALRGR